MDFEVLILGSDQNAYYMARCCFEAYHKKAYLIGKEPLAFTRFSNILTITYEPNIWNEEVFVKVLEEFSFKHPDKKILLISTNETYAEFIAKNKNKIPANYIYNYPKASIIESLTNKEKFYKTYANQELVFPQTLYFDCQKDKLTNLNLTYPLIVKPANVVQYNHLRFANKNKIYKINSEEELNNTILTIKEGGYQDKLILQEFIPGDDSHLFDAVVYVNTKGKVEFMTFAQIGLQERTKSMVGNAAVLINGFNTFQGNVLNQTKAIKKFLERIGYSGFAEVDMKYDERDNTFKVLEINARQGRCSYYATSLGKNLVQQLVNDCLYDKQEKYQFLDNQVLLSFVPKGIIKKYINNQEFKTKALAMWKNVVKPMDAPSDKNFLRFLQLRKRWFHYYKEYKNSYWK